MNAITIHAEPTDEDYRHAHTAHRIWKQMTWQRTKWRTGIMAILWLLPFIAIGLFVLIPDFQSQRKWIVSPFWLIASVALCPLLGLLTLIQILISLNPAKPSGIVQRPISTQGATGAAVLRWLTRSANLIIIAGLVIMYFLAAPDQIALMTSTGLPEIPGPLLFFSASVATMMVLGLVNRVQRWRQQRIASSFTALLLPRDWEFSEDHLVERDSLLESRMKWEYINKFLETPRVIMLYPNENMFYLVPKNSFTSDLQLAHFMSLLMEKVPIGVIQPRGGRGFPIQPVQQK